METTNEKFPKKKVLILILITFIIAGGVITPIILLVQSGLNDNPNGGGQIDISVETAYDMITDKDTYPNLIILDVRTLSEYDAGHLNNSILIPNTELEARIDELSGYENTEIIVYCRSGARSALASTILVDNNFTEVYNMLGGFEAWVEADYFVPD
jgi:rhodanese-related sulfurtransferase